MFSQDDGTDGIQHTTHSTLHEAGGRPSPLQAAAATPCPAPGHGDVGGIPWSPAGTEGGAIHTPLTSHSLPQTLFGAAQRVSWPDGQTLLGLLPPSAQSQAPHHGVQEECLGSAAKGQPSGWHGFFCPRCLALVNHFKSCSFCKCFSSIKAAVSGLRQKCWCFIGSGEHQHRITPEALILLRLHWMD